MAISEESPHSMTSVFSLVYYETLSIECSAVGYGFRLGTSPELFTIFQLEIISPWRRRPKIYSTNRKGSGLMFLG